MRVAFVMEQTLGHMTHYRNLRAATADRPGLSATWLPIPFSAGPVGRLVPLFRGNWSVRASWRARRALGAELARGPLDAALFHTQVASLFSIDLMGRLPTVVSLDDTPINYDSMGEHYNHRPAGTGFVDHQKFRLNRRALHAAAGLVSWSEWARRSCVEDYGVPADRVRVIAPGAAPAYFEIGQRRLSRPTPTAPAMLDRPVRLLFVGGDFRRKGGPQLLEALRRPLGVPWELHVVTQQPVPPTAGVVVHRGIGPNSPELLRLFEESDLFILPSLGECLSIVLMEATAAGLPVVTTDVGALAEAVHVGGADESGLIVPPGDVAALHAALAELAGDGARRERMGRAGHALATDKFDSRRNAATLLDVIAEVVTARAALEHRQDHGRPGRAA